ncbi:hypothetical protein C8J55DRAFT_531057 [Lentinula edodes]|uniref:Uncharacterized protein n=1 Tax=Lentinula lateritia TaxID=40482 RepID=A0A9W8ZRJ6_9AGAR|nr:hypothetical protein C8J55DRAFT_531057 [Lentinula edodes]
MLFPTGGSSFISFPSSFTSFVLRIRFVFSFKFVSLIPVSFRIRFVYLPFLTRSLYVLSNSVSFSLTFILFPCFFC